LAVAALPGLAGISGSIQDAATIDRGFTIAMEICAGLLVTGALLAGALLGESRRDRRAQTPTEPTVDCLPQCGMTGPAVQPRHPEQTAGR
ncbi:MFS transporter, partial [Nocardia gipuzkoensis]